MSSLLRNLAMIVGAAGILTACSAAFLDTSALGIFQRKDINLTEKNYAAADFLIQQGINFVNKGDLIKATPLSESNEQHKVTKIAKIIPEEAGIRLAQLGYRLDLAEVTSSPDANYLKPQMIAGEEPKFLIGGSYLRRRLEMDVSLRITEVKTSRVVAAFNYTLPMNRDINEISAPEIEIYRTTE